MKLKKVSSLGIAITLCMAFVINGCKKSEDIVIEDITVEEITDVADVEEVETLEPITEFTMFIARTNDLPEVTKDNDVAKMIAEKTGVIVKESWLEKNEDAIEAVDRMIEADELPDIIDAGDASQNMYENSLLVPWDEYIEKYPNLKELYSDEEWEEFRQSDGHIYWANVFRNTYGEERSTIHNDEAFWIQARVLEWDNYPTIETVEEYFDLLERYYECNKSFVNSKNETVDIIPFTSLTDDWRYFCIQNVPLFLDGYPNDGICIVDVTSGDAPTVRLFQTTDTAKTYYGILNEEYKKGIMYEDFDTQLYDEYIEMLSTGAVLGMVDQYWNFAYNIQESYEENGLNELGCEYVPLGLTLEKGTPQKYHLYGDIIDWSSGTAITTKCEDPEKAFKFLNDILEQDVHDLRFWGVKDVDYCVDENGLYYRTDEMRERLEDDDYVASHMCQYSYLPQWLGTSRDGINAMQPKEQASEFYESISKPLAECLKAYGADSFGDMVGSTDNNAADQGPWFPMQSYSSYMSTDTPGQEAYRKMSDAEHEWLPKIVKASDYEAAWNSYMKAFDACNPQDFIEEQQYELEYRIAAKSNKMN